VVIATVWLWLHTTLDHQLYNTEKQKDHLCSFVASNEKRKRPFQVTDIEAALIHTIGQGVE